MADDEEVVALSPEEISKVRAIILNHDRGVWLRSSIRVVAIWIGAVVGGTTLFWDALGRILRLLGGK